MHPKAQGSRNYTQCDSLLIGERVRGAHRPLHRGQEQLEPGRARGDDVEGRRGPAVLLPPARHGRGGGGGAGRQRLLQGGPAGPAHGVRHGSTTARGDKPRGISRLMPGVQVNDAHRPGGAASGHAGGLERFHDDRLVRASELQGCADLRGRADLVGDRVLRVLAGGAGQPDRPRSVQRRAAQDDPGGHHAGRLRRLLGART